MNRIAYVACALGLLLTTACRDDDPTNPGTDGGPGSDGTIPGGEVEIQQIQDDAMPAGTQVEVKGVVVTAIDSFGSRTGDLWVQEPEGGPFSGIKVFGAPLDQLALLQPGDIVDITNAQKDEFALDSDMSGRKVTELKPAAGGTLTVTKVGTGELPAPAAVDALAIGMMGRAERDAEWEKWEGVLITVSKARQVSDVRGFGDMEIDQQEFRITGDARVQSAMTELPEGAATADCYTVTGVGDYFFNWLVLPTSADQIADSDACAPEEEGEAACADEIDNDGDGFTDCDDRSCSATCSTAATIADIQAGTVTGVVVLDGVYVTARTGNNKHVWVSQSLTAAPNEGIFVFRGSNASDLPASIVPGAKVNVTGTVQENGFGQGDTTTQLGAGATVTFVEAPTSAPVPVSGQTAAALVVAATGEPYESVLVTLTDVKVNSIGTADFWVGELQQGATTFLSDDDIMKLEDADLNKCFTMTGIWTYQVFDDEYGLLPMTKTETPCP